jgi:hypothetical protein
MIRYGDEIHTRNLQPNLRISLALPRSDQRDLNMIVRSNRLWRVRFEPQPAHASLLRATFPPMLFPPLSEDSYDLTCAQ